MVLFRENGSSTPRLGLALTKKLVNKATQRNRLKRVIRESFRLHDIRPVDVIFLARAGVDKIKNKSIINNLEQLWQKINATAGN